jgi:hypothetical protein
VFILIAIVGGFSGALWNHLNERITRFRMNYIQVSLLKVLTNKEDTVRKKILFFLQNKYIKWLEAVSCGVTASSMAFIMMVLANDCKPVDIDDNE